MTDFRRFRVKERRQFRKIYIDIYIPKSAVSFLTRARDSPARMLLLYCRTFFATAIQDAKHLVAMARASSALGLNEPPPALIAKCDAARGIPIDRGQPEGLESEQQFRSSKVQVKTVSVVHSVGDEGTGDEKHGTIGSLTSPSRGKELKNTAISSQVGRSIGKHRSFEHSTACNRNPYVPLHGFISFLGDLHMRTPQEILEKVRTRRCGGAGIFLLLRFPV